MCLVSGNRQLEQRDNTASFRGTIEEIDGDYTHDIIAIDVFHTHSHGFKSRKKQNCFKS